MTIFFRNITFHIWTCAVMAQSLILGLSIPPSSSRYLVFRHKILFKDLLIPCKFTFFLSLDMTLNTNVKKGFRMILVKVYLVSIPKSALCRARGRIWIQDWQAGAGGQRVLYSYHLYPWVDSPPGNPYLTFQTLGTQFQNFQKTTI